MTINQLSSFVPSRKHALRCLACMSIAASLMMTTSPAFSQFSLQDDDDPEERIVKILANGDMQQIESLFENGLSLNQNIDGDGTPLIIAAQNRNYELVEYLVDNGADVNLESTQDGNPLIAAALANDLSLVKYLHSHGAKIDAITKYDETALISASRAGHFKIVKYLVENGADVNLGVDANVRLGKEWRTPLNGARTEEIRQFLLSSGAKL